MRTITMVPENVKSVLDREDILDLFRSLSKFQGFYGRLLRDYENGDTELVDALVEAKFTDTFDVIRAIEQ